MITAEPASPPLTGIIPVLALLVSVGPVTVPVLAMLSLFDTASTFVILLGFRIVYARLYVAPSLMCVSSLRPFSSRVRVSVRFDRFM